MKILSLIGYGLIVLGMAGLWRIHALFAVNPILIAAQVAAVGLMVWARITFGRRSFHAAANPTEGGLVTTGPYRMIRHPIYTAISLFMTAGALGRFSVISVALLLVIFAGTLIRMFCEEHLLVQRYPEYKTYSERTHRMVPGVF